MSEPTMPTPHTNSTQGLLHTTLLLARRSGLSTLLGSLAVAITLTAGFFFMTGALGMESVEQRTLASLKSHIIFSPSANQHDIQATQTLVSSWQGVATAELHTPTANLAMLRRDIGKPLDGLQTALLPTTMTVSFRSPAEDLPALHDQLHELQTQPSVEAVETAPLSSASLASSLPSLRWTMIALALLTLLVGGIVIVAIQAYQSARDREEIALLLTIGADDQQITWPMYQRAILYGCVGGLTAAGAAALSQLVLTGPISGAFASPTNPLWLTPILFVAGVAMAVLATATGTARWIQQAEETIAP